MLVKGTQEERFDYSADRINEEILALNGFLSEEDARVYLYKFLRNNIGFAAEFLLGVKLFPFQVIIIKSMMLGDFSMFVLSRGLSKCSVWNEIVFTKNGPKKIIDVEVGDEVQSLYSYNKVEGKTINSRQKIWEATTKSGYHSGGLDYHRTLVFNPSTLDFDWIFSKDLKIGDVISIRKGFDIWGQENQNFISAKDTSGQYSFYASRRSVKDWYYFFGLLIGDGHATGGRGLKNGVGFTTGDIQIANWLAQFVADVTDEEVKTPKLSNGTNTYLVTLIRKEFFNWAISLGFDFNKLAHEKVIPQGLLDNTKENICTLLSGLYDTDGYVSKGKKGGGTIGFTSSSMELITQVQNLLLNLGIESSKQETFKGGLSDFGGVKYECKKAWSICICNNTTVGMFHDKINFGLQRKKERLSEIVSSFKNKDSNHCVPCCEYIKSKYGGYFPKIGLKLSYGCRSITKNKLKKLYDAEVFDDEDSVKIKKILDLDIYYDEIKSIEEREDITVDLQVANERCYYSNGFINHNTFSAAIYIMLQLLFRQGIKIGVLSSGFRQSKMILQKVEDIKKKSGCLTADLFKLVKGTDQWTLTCGNSEAYALPLADGSRLRGFRFSILILDEFLNIPKNIFQEVILPFLGVIDNPTERAELIELEDKLIGLGQMEEHERYRWTDNKLIVLSSPSYTFQYMYEVYCLYRDQILGVAHKTIYEDESLELANAYSVIIQLAYDVAPPTLYDKNQLKQAKTTMSDAVFAKEYGGQFISESDSYFKLSKMMACTIPDGDAPHIEVSGNSNSKYIIALDPSWSEDSSSDDFAISVFKLNDDSQTGCLVHSYGMAGTPMKSHIYYLFYLITHFNVQTIVLDYAGGLQFISACNESLLFKENKIELGVINEFIPHDFDKPEEYQEDLRAYQNALKPTQRIYCYFRQAHVSWIRQANELLQANIDRKRIFFGSQPLNEDYTIQLKKKIPITHLKFSKKYNTISPEADMIEFLDHQFVMLEQTKQQTANIEITTNPQGSQTFRLPVHMARQTGPNRPRKDNYSTLVLGNWMIKVYYDMLNVEEKEKPQATFTPFVI